MGWQRPLQKLLLVAGLPQIDCATDEAAAQVTIPQTVIRAALISLGPLPFCLNRLPEGQLYGLVALTGFERQVRVPVFLGGGGILRSRVCLD